MNLHLIFTGRTRSFHLQRAHPLTPAPLHIREGASVDEGSRDGEPRIEPGDATVRRSIRVFGAGDSRANGVYLRAGEQNGAPRWRHVDRPWLCILRDGSSWWIGAERPAREDLYWCDATGIAPPRWKVCPCDDRVHRHFRGSFPVPSLGWVEEEESTRESLSVDADLAADLAATKSPPRAAQCEDSPGGSRVFEADECPICLCDGQDSVRMPCGHVACAICLAHARAASPHVGNEDCSRCPLPARAAPPWPA